MSDEPWRGRSGSGAIDEFWQDIPPKDVVLVAMTGAHATAYQRWLRSLGLHLFRSPEEGDEPLYLVGVRDDASFLPDPALVGFGD